MGAAMRLEPKAVYVVVVIAVKVYRKETSTLGGWGTSSRSTMSVARRNAICRPPRSPIVHRSVEKQRSAKHQREGMLDYAPQLARTNQAVRVSQPEKINPNIQAVAWVRGYSGRYLEQYPSPRR